MKTVDLASLPKTVGEPPLVWVDRMTIGVRADINVGTLRFFSAFEDHLSEACRLQMSVDHLKQIAEVICRVTNYYPTKR